MLSSLIQICKNVQFISKPLPPLGRWSTNNNNNKGTIIKSILANHDCCGDRLCGNPLNVKEQIDKILFKKN
tara:strand:- start:57 stop:269 length:213 start_codon:yes stop_codon:yes gene_type:complete